MFFLLGGHIDDAEYPDLPFHLKNQIQPELYSITLAAVDNQKFKEMNVSYMSITDSSVLRPRCLG